MNQKDMWLMLARYFVLILLSLSNLAVIYLIFTPLTLYGSYFLLSLSYPDATLLADSPIIKIQGISIALVEACIAGSAYFFLLILNLSTPMGSKTRIKSLLFIILSFLILNIIRIVMFSILAIKGFPYFDAAHLYAWYFGSTLLLLLVWFANVKFLNILSIPVYTDIKTILEDVRKKNKSLS